MIRFLTILIILSTSFVVYAERKFNLETGEYEEVETGNWEDYRISRDNALDADSYNRRSDSLSSDFDNDGRPNYIDPYDNEGYKNPAFRDYDNDGGPNITDPYDNDWYK